MKEYLLLLLFNNVILLLIYFSTFVVITQKNNVIVSQIARHTGDYENYPSLCCSNTGLPDNAPMVV